VQDLTPYGGGLGTLTAVRAEPSLGAILNRYLGRDALPLVHHGETVVLVNDPLDVPDEVLRGRAERVQAFS
jgi:hypothetical protein